MTLKWMLDTWAAVALMRRRDEELMRRVAALPPEELCLSAISLAELRFGIEMSARPEQDRAALELLLRHVTVVGFGSEAAEVYGEMRVVCELRQEGIGVHALLVAAHARQMGVTLLRAGTADSAQALHPDRPARQEAWRARPRHPKARLSLDSHKITQKDDDTPPSSSAW